MYTSILGNKQSTINNYMYFFLFFSLSTYKKVLGRHKLSCSTIIKLVQESNFPLLGLMPLTVGEPTENRLRCKARKKKNER